MTGRFTTHAAHEELSNAGPARQDTEERRDVFVSGKDVITVEVDAALPESHDEVNDVLGIGINAIAIVIDGTALCGIHIDADGLAHDAARARDDQRIESFIVELRIGER
jgi:hypothetical protein